MEELKDFASRIKQTSESVASMKHYLLKSKYKQVIGDVDINTPVTILTLGKKDITNPQFGKCVEQGMLSATRKNASLVVKCSDQNLFFNEAEAMNLMNNFEIVQAAGGTIVFEETINADSRGIQYGRKDEKKVAIYAEFLHRVLVAYPEMMGVNKKLTTLADKVNKISAEQNFSPLEKYLLCQKIIGELECADESGKIYVPTMYMPSQSFVETIRRNKGCCLGKSQYLKALLSLVGIDSCVIYTNSAREYLLVNKAHGIEVENDEKSITYGDHAFNLIHLEDPKYGISGIFAGDAVRSEDLMAFIPLNDDVSMLFNWGGVFTSCDELEAFLNKLPTQVLNADKNLSDADKKQKIQEELNAIRNQTGDLFYAACKKSREKIGRCAAVLARLKQSKFEKSEKLNTVAKAQQKVCAVYKKYFYRKKIDAAGLKTLSNAAMGTCSGADKTSTKEKC